MKAKPLKSRNTNIAAEQIEPPHVERNNVELIVHLLYLLTVRELDGLPRLFKNFRLYFCVRQITLSKSYIIVTI